MVYDLKQRIVILDARLGRCGQCGSPDAITVIFVVETAPGFTPRQVEQLTDCDYCDPDPADLQGRDSLAPITRPLPGTPPAPR